MQSPMPNRAKVGVLCIGYGFFVCCVHKGVKSCWVAMGGLYGCLRSKDMNANLKIVVVVVVSQTKYALDLMQINGICSNAFLSNHRFCIVRIYTLWLVLGGYGEREETMVSNLMQKVESRKTKGNGTRKVDFSLYPLLFFEWLNWLL